MAAFYHLLVALLDGDIAFVGAFPSGPPRSGSDPARLVLDHASRLQRMRHWGDRRPLDAEHLSENFLDEGKCVTPDRPRARSIHQQRRAEASWAPLHAAVCWAWAND